jgi:serine/threonine protein kinase
VWSPVLGTTLGNYRVVERLGEGGMGLVYIGRHETLGSRVVVKVLQPELSRNVGMVQRFFNEAQAATEIRHPGIVQVFDFGTTSDGRAYFVMELLEGETLSARLRKHRHDAAACCRFGRQVANVLQAAHAVGITHRDLKPENLFLVTDPEVIGGERVKVLDFGIAKLAGESRPAGVKTQTGMVMGTPDYMSPEQCRSASTADARSDIYSLGCILFEVACGRPPFVGDGMAEVIAAHLHLPPPPPRSLVPDLPAGLAALITHMLEKRPDARPQSMAEVSRALDELARAHDGSATRAASLIALPAPPSSRVLPPSSPGSATLQPWSRTSEPRRAGTRWMPFVLGAVVIGVAATAIAVVNTRDDARGEESRVDYDQIVASRSAPSPAVVEAAPTVVVPPPTVVAPPPTVVAPPPTVVAPPPAAPVPTAAPSPVASAPPGPTPSASATAIDAGCRELQAARKWNQLVECAAKLRPLDPARAEELGTRAVAEIRSAPRVAGVESALRDHQLKRARAELDQVWTESVTYADVKKAYDAAEAQAIGELATALARVKDTSCGEHARVVARARDTSPARVISEAARRSPCTPPAKCNADELSEKALTQFRANAYAAALALYEAAYTCSPAPALLQKAFIVACNLRNLPKAKAYWKRLSTELRTQANGTCVRNGITVETLNAP